MRAVKKSRRRILPKLLLGAGAVVLAVGAAGLVSTDWLRALGGKASGERLERMKDSARWNGEVFENTVETSLDFDASQSLALMREWIGGEAQTEPEGAYPVVRPDWSAPPASGLRVTWLGHSASLVEIDGRRLLLDPMLGERASPSTLAGPKRFHPAPVAVDELPQVDAVVISHDHYDHLDYRTIQALDETVPRFLVPLGVGAHLEAWGVAPAKITELDWWERTSVGGVELVATPARHFSGRGIANRNSTLWASWTILGPDHRVFFSGDTGPFEEGFVEIARRFGPFDLAMFEIGAQHPSWGEIHLGPHEAVKAFEAIDARVFLPIHWGTFNLALHGWREPMETVFAESQDRGIRLATPRPGESFEPARPPAPTPWWREIP